MTINGIRPMKPHIIFIGLLCMAAFACKPEEKDNLAVTRGQSYSAEKFLDMDWRSSRETVKEAMIQRKDVAYSPDLSSESRQFFKGGEYEGHPVLYWMFDFSDSGLYYVGVVFKSENDSELKVKKRYQTIKNYLHEKYGEPIKDLFYFEPPYETDGARQLFNAIKSGKAHIETWWEVKGVKIHLILAGPHKFSPSIMLRYENLELSKNVDTEKLLEF
jgi:hypothetical protein